MGGEKNKHHWTKGIARRRTEIEIERHAQRQRETEREMNDDEMKEISLVDKTDLPNILHSLRFFSACNVCFSEAFLSINGRSGRGESWQREA